MPKAESSGFCNMNLIQMEITMNFKRAFLTLVVLMLLPALAQAATVRFETGLLWVDNDIDGNGAIQPRPLVEVDVEIVCTTGLPLTQPATITDIQGVIFVVEELIDGEGVNCTINRVENQPELVGFIEWRAQNYGVLNIIEDLELGGCVFLPVDLGVDGINECLLINQAMEGSFTVHTNWELTGVSPAEVPYADQRIRIECSEDFVGSDGFTSNAGGYFYEWRYVDLGTFSEVTGLWHDSTTVVGIEVTADGLTDCRANDRDIRDISAVVTQTNCRQGNRNFIAPGGSNSCSFDYTVFFEGIPTLSQYGLAIMALLMLGVGFVGFRRFV